MIPSLCNFGTRQLSKGYHIRSPDSSYSNFNAYALFTLRITKRIAFTVIRQKKNLAKMNGYDYFLVPNHFLYLIAIYNAGPILHWYTFIKSLQHSILDKGRGRGGGGRVVFKEFFTLRRAYEYRIL